MFIYLVTCLANGKGYVGKTTRSIKKRWWEHVQASRKGKMQALPCAIRKYGEKQFKVTILSVCSSISKLKSLERQKIENLGTLAPAGYNMTSGGDGFEDSKLASLAARRCHELHPNLARENGMRTCDAALLAGRNNFRRTPQPSGKNHPMFGRNRVHSTNTKKQMCVSQRLRREREHLIAA